ncbi:MAG: hypothetical protein Kow0062_23320 [Acidobacteriota bacterium]
MPRPGGSANVLTPNALAVSGAARADAGPRQLVTIPDVALSGLPPQDPALLARRARPYIRGEVRCALRAAKGVVST